MGDTIIDVRVATLPTLYGENVVMRMLDRTAIKIDLPSAGLRRALCSSKSIWSSTSPTGSFLVTGPTGSGKTTTLYACVNELNTPEVKIITTEDPVELQIDQLMQCQVREDIGLTFASCLRAILRQDPDIVMVGEIRDLETAQHRHRGLAHRSPGAEHAAHEQRARDRLRVCSTWTWSPS